MNEAPAAGNPWRDIEVGTDLGSYDYVLTNEILATYRSVVGYPEASYPTVASRHCSHLFMRAYPDRSEHMNAGHECEYHNPPRAGGRIVVSGKVVANYEKRGRPYLVIEARAVNEEGLLIEVSRMLALGSIKEVARKWE